MKIAVIGAGAIGGTLGGHMTRGGEDVTIFDPWQEHIDAMLNNGLLLDGVQGEHRVQVDARHVRELAGATDKYDLIIVAVKSYDTPWAIDLMLPHLAEGGFFVSPQNSINEEQIAPLVGANRMLGCVSTISAWLMEPGHVRQTGSMSQALKGNVSFTVGELDGRATERAETVRALWDHAGTAIVTDNLWGERWSKLAINCMANPSAGMTGLTSHEVRANPESRRMMLKFGAEAIRVGRTLGHSIPSPMKGFSLDDIEAAAWEGNAELEATFSGPPPAVAGYPSLYQDVMKGRKTEIDYLNGLIVRKGKEIGVAAPWSEAAVTVIKGVESGEFPVGMENVARVERIAGAG